MLWKPSKLTAIFAAIAISTLLFGCTTRRYYGTRPPDPIKAIIAGYITEAFLTQPHGLMVHIRKVGERYTTVPLATLNAEEDQPSLNLRGNLFMYEVPEGSYEIYNWNYTYYRGEAAPRANPVIFSVKAGETAHIGDFYANALTSCLSSVNNAETTVAALKHKYPVLNGRTVQNLTPWTTLHPWPNSDARDYGNGLCKL